MGYYIEKYFGEFPPPWMPLKKHGDSWYEGFTESDRLCPGAYEIALRECLKDGRERYDIIYIGESHKGDLGDRLYAFRSAIDGGGVAHTAATKFDRGKTHIEDCYFRIYPIRENVQSDETTLQVSKSVLAQLFERELVWDYCKQHSGNIPVLNDH